MTAKLDDIEPREQPRWYVLQEYEVEHWDDPQLYSSHLALDVNGDLMVLDDLDNAQGMARFILGADHEGPEREPREGLLPLIAITEFDYPPTREPVGNEGGWACGWITLDGQYHDGDYENDEALWDAMRAWTKANR
jgi:hypothetical protein